jgi:exodeoxyribonuclease-3
MKIATWNVNGIRARQQQVLELIEAEKPDVLCLQELKAKREQVPEALCTMSGYWCYWHGDSAYSGVSLHIAKQRCVSEPPFEHPHFDHETRIVQAQLADIVFASVYVPNGGKDFAAKMNFLSALQKFAAAIQASGRKLVVCGDLNVARSDRDVHPKERRPNAIGQRPEERAALERLIASGLVDVGRALDPENDNLFTWWAPWRNMRQRNIGWRLDYVLASQSLALHARSCRVLREHGTSDHGAVVAEIED